MNRAIRLAFVVVALAVLPGSAAVAGERLVDGILGGAAGGLVLGPVGLVGGAIIGATAGPGMARSWGFKRRSAHQPNRRYARRY